MADYYTYGSVPDVDSTVYGMPAGLSGRFELINQKLAEAPPPAPVSTTSSSAPTWYRWSDGTYNRNPQSTGIRTPYSELPDQYKQLDSRRPSTLQPAAQGPSGLGSLTSQELPVTKPEISGLAPASEGPAGPGSLPSQELPVTKPEISGLVPVSEGPAGPGSLPSQELPIERPQIVTSGLLEEYPVGPPPLALLGEPQEPEPSVEMFVHPDGVKRPYPPAPQITGPVGALTPLPEEPVYGETISPALEREDPGPIIYSEEPVSVASEEYNVPQSLPQTRSDPVATPYIPPGLEAAFLRMQGQSPEQLAAREQVVSETKSQRDVLSELLRTNQFDAAFRYAIENGVQNLLIDPTELRTLRGPFSNDEMRLFFSSMPKNLMGEQSEEEVRFDPQVGLQESLQQQTAPSGLSALGLGGGYPQVQRAFVPLEQKKEDGLFEDIIKTVLAAGTLYAGASALPGLIGAGGAGGTVAGTTGAAGAGTAGAAGAGGIGALTGVVPSGLIPGAVSAAGLGTATFPIIASSGLTASQLAALGAGVAGAGSMIGAGGTSPTVPGTPEAPLDEVVVTGQRALDPALRGLLPTSLASTNLMQGVSDIPTDIYGQVETVEPTSEEPLEEVVVTAQRPPLSNLLGLGAGAIPTTTPVDLPTPDIVDGRITYPESDLEEVVVTGTRPPLSDLLNLGSLGLPISTGLDLLQPEVVDGRITYPESDLEEVVVEGTRPTDGGLNLPPFSIPLKTPVDLPEPKINEPSTLKNLLDQFGTVENLLKLLGSLGSAGAGRGGTTTPAMPTGGLGGALPKYNFARKQLSPDIDYYTYGFRPEAKFFEDTVQLEKPIQPALPPAMLPPNTLPPATLPPATLPGEPKVMATGGLSGYAKGGSNKSRYVAGPGSGREDKIPALLSDGEYVIDAETLALLGDGSTKEGARRMDKFRANIRKHKGRALSRGRISPNAKSPSKYMGGGLT